MEVDPRTAINRRREVFSRCHQKQKHLLSTYNPGNLEATREDEPLEATDQLEVILLNEPEEPNPSMNPVANVEKDINTKLIKLRTREININLETTNQSRTSNSSNRTEIQDPEDESGPVGARKSLVGSPQINWKIFRKNNTQIFTNHSASNEANTQETNLNDKQGEG